MTLVPIIYTSLLIFSALLFFVIITSYISFKLKPQKKFAHQNTEPPSQININRVHNYQNPAPMFVKNYNATSVIKERYVNHSNLNNKPLKSESKNFSETIQREKKRLEIMNTKEMFTKNENFHSNIRFEDKNNNKNKNFRITDANILDFYSDNSINQYSSYYSI